MLDTKILIVDDDANICDLLKLYFENEGYKVKTANDGAEGVSSFKLYDPDLVLLDIMMPKKDGWQVCREIREISSKPIIMITAKSEVFDKVLGLELGADDYVIKPFSPSELTARIDALCRRIGVSEASEEKAGEQELKSGPFKLDLKSRALYKNDEIIEITGVEFQIMELFMRNPDAALKRSVILKSVWGDSYVGEEKIVDVNIRRVRMKIEKEPSNPEYLQTIWGYGYKWTMPQN